MGKASKGGTIAAKVGAVVMTVVIAGGVCACGYASRDENDKWFKNGNLKTWHWTDKSPAGVGGNVGDNNNNSGKDDNFTGGSEIGDVVDKGIKLYSAEIPRAAYAANGVSEQAENAYTITAEVSPDYASDKALDWLVSWFNADSEFASGKTVTDYVTITPTADGASSAVCVCLQDFGEPVVITVVSRSNPEVSGVCTVQYYQRIKSCNYVFKFDGEEVTPTIDNGVYKVDYTGAEKDYIVELSPEYSNYTLTDSYQTTINGKFSTAFGYSTAQTLTTLKIPAGLLGGEPEISEAALKWTYSVTGAINSDLSTYLMATDIKNSGSVPNVYYKLTAEDKQHPRVQAYYKAITTVNASDYENTKAQAWEIIHAYVGAPYTFNDVVKIPTYNDFVTAVRNCNTANVGVLQYTVQINGAHSTYETVLNLGYNDDFKVNVQDIDLSDNVIAF